MNPIYIGRYSALQANQRAFAILPHEEPNCHCSITAGNRVDMLNAVNLPEQLFKRGCNELFHLLSAGTWK